MPILLSLPMSDNRLLIYHNLIIFLNCSKVGCTYPNGCCILSKNEVELLTKLLCMLVMQCQNPPACDNILTRGSVSREGKDA